jgi:hypothetical protein
MTKLIAELIEQRFGFPSSAGHDTPAAAFGATARESDFAGIPDAPRRLSLDPRSGRRVLCVLSIWRGKV